jgi:hypothetical protein
MIYCQILLHDVRVYNLWDPLATGGGGNVKNITITLDEAMAIWLREHAAKHGVSVSRFVGDLVHERMEGAYRAHQHPGIERVLLHSDSQAPTGNTIG